MKLDIQKNKIHILMFRADEKLFDKIQILAKEHKTERSAVIRSLIDLGLRQLTSKKIT